MEYSNYNQNQFFKRKIYNDLLKERINQCNEKLKTDPCDINSYFELSDIAVHTSQYELSNDFLRVAKDIEPNSLKLLLRQVNNLLKTKQFDLSYSLILNFLNNVNLYSNFKQTPEIFSFFSKILASIFRDIPNSFKSAKYSINKLPLNHHGYEDLACLYIHELGDIQKGRKILYEALNKFVSTNLVEVLISSFSLDNPKIGLKKLNDFFKNKKYDQNSLEILKYNLLISTKGLNEQKKQLSKIKKIIDNNHYKYEQIQIDQNYLDKINIDAQLLKVKSITENLSFQLDHNLKKSMKRQLFFLNNILAQKYKRTGEIRKELTALECINKIGFELKYNFDYNRNFEGFRKSMPLEGFQSQKKFNNLPKNVKQTTHEFYPIFIIGLPRSGSTLLESIISGSDHIFSCDECQIVNKYMNNLSTLKNKIKIMDLYFNNFPELINFRLFTDKSLNNFMYIDFILDLFPNAKFINCMRDPRENAISILKMNFTSLPWSYDLGSILDYMDQYFKIIKYYISKFESKIYTCHHKNLVNNKEYESQRIFKFLNIEWKPEYLEIEKSHIMTNTASKRQIRNKISKKFLNKYKDYFKILETYSNRYSWLR